MKLLIHVVTDNIDQSWNTHLMEESSSTRPRKHVGKVNETWNIHRITLFSGVRFTSEEKDALTSHEENPHRKSIILISYHVRTFTLIHHTTLDEFNWDDYSDEQQSFDLYFGILKLSHIYTTTFDVISNQSSGELVPCVDLNIASHGLQLTVKQIPKTDTNGRVHFEAELSIDRKALPGPFHQIIHLKDTTNPDRAPMKINVTGKVLREGQGTAMLRQGVRMKGVISLNDNDDD